MISRCANVACSGQLRHLAGAGERIFHLAVASTPKEKIVSGKTAGIELGKKLGRDVRRSSSAWSYGAWSSGRSLYRSDRTGR